MKTIFLTLALCLCSLCMKAQLTGATKSTFDACWAMRQAIGSGSTNALRSATAAFKACGTTEFSTLRPVTPDVNANLNNHFVWDEDFAEALLANHKVRKFAQQYAEQRNTRGTTGIGNRQHVTTRLVKGKQKATFSFPARGHMELAVISEPGAKVTIRIQDVTNGTWHNDTEDVVRGRDYRIHVFDLPANKKCSLKIEIANCSKKDASFAVICN